MNPEVPTKFYRKERPHDLWRRSYYLRLSPTLPIFGQSNIGARLMAYPNHLKSKPNKVSSYVLFTVSILVFIVMTTVALYQDIISYHIVEYWASQIPEALYWHGLTLIMLGWIINHRPSKVWDEITYPFPIFNGCTVEVWKWRSNFITYF